MTNEIDLLNISFTIVKYLFLLADFYVAGAFPCGNFIMITYEVKVKTGVKSRAGTDANVTLVLLGSDGKVTKHLPLDNLL